MHLSVALLVGVFWAGLCQPVGTETIGSNHGPAGRIADQFGLRLLCGANRVSEQADTAHHRGAELRQEV